MSIDIWSSGDGMGMGKILAGTAEDWDKLVRERVRMDIKFAGVGGIIPSVL